MFTVDRDDHYNPPLRIDFHLQYTPSRTTNQAGAIVQDENPGIPGIMRPARSKSPSE